MLYIIYMYVAAVHILRKRGGILWLILAISGPSLWIYALNVFAFGFPVAMLFCCWKCVCVYVY